MTPEQEARAAHVADEIAADLEFLLTVAQPGGQRWEIDLPNGDAIKGRAYLDATKPVIGSMIMAFARAIVRETWNARHIR